MSWNRINVSNTADSLEDPLFHYREYILEEEGKKYFSILDIFGMFDF